MHDRDRVVGWHVNDARVSRSKRHEGAGKRRRSFVKRISVSALIQRTKKMRRKTRDRTVFRRFEREARGRVGERDILGEKQVAGRSCSRIGDPVGSTGSQRLFRSGVPTIGGELGSSGVSRVAPFVKEAPSSCSRSGQMSNPVGNRLPFYICARAHARTHTYA